MVSFLWGDDMYNILVTDDEEMIRKLIRKYAEFEGHSVSEAANGMEALIQLKNNHFDLVVMDIMMQDILYILCCLHCHL